MINPLLHSKPVVADRNEHRNLRMKVPVTDWSVASKLNAIFVAGIEFGDAARDFPLVFVRAGDDDEGKAAIAPIAVMGVTKEDNLFVDRDGSWRARYTPAMLAMYPFAIGRVDSERFVIVFDGGWSGLSGTEGERLFKDDGAHTDFLTKVQTQLETMESHVQSTRLMCRELLQHDLLVDMRFDATLPDGSAFAVDGFLTVDEKKLNALDDATILKLHRNGVLGLVHAHYVSLGNMRKLLDWHIERLPAAAKA